MADLIMISPDSGDDSAAIFDLATGRPLATVSKGTVFQLSSNQNDGFHIKYDDGSVTKARGGTEMSGVVAAFPGTDLYRDLLKSKVIGYINNGTTCIINDDSNESIFMISAQTDQGYQSGYIPSKYIIRDGESPEEDEEGDDN